MALASLPRPQKIEIHEEVNSTEYLTPEQRAAAVAEILATAALRIIKEQDE